MATKRPIFKIHSKALCRDGEASVFLSHPDNGYCGNVLSATLREGKIRLDVYGATSDEDIDVLVNIKAEQSLHPAIIVMAHELDVLRSVAEHRPSMSEVRDWDYQILAKLNQMGLIDGKVSAVNLLDDEEGNVHKTYDCRMMEVTQAGKFILAQEK